MLAESSRNVTSCGGAPAICSDPIEIISLNKHVEVKPNAKVAVKNAGALGAIAHATRLPTASADAPIITQRGGMRVTSNAAVMRPKIDGPQNAPTTGAALSAGSPKTVCKSCGAQIKNAPCPQRYRPKPTANSATVTRAELGDRARTTVRSAACAARPVTGKRTNSEAASSSAATPATGDVARSCQIQPSAIALAANAGRA